MSVVYEKQELKDIFDIVNSQYLRLKGKKKTISKNQFVNVWKQDNKSLSAYELMIHLYKAEEINDRQNEFLEKFMISSSMSVDEVKSKGAIPYRKYIARLRRKDEEIDELETEIDNMMEDKSLMYKEEHETLVKEIKKDLRQQIDEKDNLIGKLEMKLKHIDSDVEAKLSNRDKQIEYYKTEMAKLLASDKE
tara:strand:- start:8162 stop:8737 length:576 start_codon:yes stop_codon:yes gene_type:complete